MGVVAQTLSHKMESETAAGKLSLGDLGFIGVAIVLLFFYSKYVLSPIFQKASASTELSLVFALARFVFICSIAILPFVDLPMEVAAVIGGLSMATSSCYAVRSAKVKYIRDDIIIRYFVGVGMQMELLYVLLLSMAQFSADRA